MDCRTVEAGVGKIVGFAGQFKNVTNNKRE